MMMRALKFKIPVTTEPVGCILFWFRALERKFHEGKLCLGRFGTYDPRDPS